MKKQVKKIKDNIKKFYWFSFFREWMFIIPVIVLFWQQNGLSLTEIMILQALFAIAIVLFEVPTGVVADRVGRKQSMVIGAFIMFIASVIYGLGFNFWQFLVAESTWALGTSFISGANSAFVYDSLKQEKKEKKFKKVWGHGKAVGYFAAGASAIIGGFIADYSLRLNWLFVAIGIFLMFLVALSFKEPKHSKKVEKKSYWNHIIESFKEAVTNKNILFLVLFFSLLSAGGRVSLWFYQPYMNQSGLPIIYFGIVWASMNIFAITGSKSADKVESWLGEKGSLWLMILLLTLSLVFMSQFFIVLGFIFIFLQQFGRGFYPPIIQDYTNRHLSSKKRATLLSIQNFSASLLFAVVAPLYGYFADRFSLSTALLIVAISFFIAFSLLMWWNRKNEKTKSRA